MYRFFLLQSARCWDKATRCNGELSMVRDLRRKPETQTANNAPLYGVPLNT
jgi:hypothetical protein